MTADQPTLNLALAHRHFSADCFNRTWALIENPQRTAEDDEQMILVALASLWHWTQRKDRTNQNLSVGHWQAARVYSLVKQGENAMRHAKRCLYFSNGLSPFIVAYAHEAIARAAAVLGDEVKYKTHLAKAQEFAQAVTDPHEKELLAPDLASLREMA